MARRGVDPRDFLRGDYVVLSYEVSRLRSVEGGQPLAVDPEDEDDRTP